VKSNLLIVGNGFDLKCGLKSTYRNFFQSRISEDVKKSIIDLSESLIFETNHNSIYFHEEEKYKKESVGLPFSSYSLIKDANLTFWDLLFLLYYGENVEKDWHDIENNMLNILHKFKFTKVYTKDFSNLGKLDRYKDYLFSRDIKGERNFKEKLRLCCILAYFVLEPERYNAFRSMEEFLQSELRIFEKAFNTFLWDLVDSSKDYHTNALSLLHQIIGMSSDSEDYSVLSFNYTVPNCFEGKVTNVHGKLNNWNIIFGVDQNEIEATSPIFTFTKTYRKLIQPKKDNENFIYIDGKDDLKNIFFYGHSLSPLDYSYFQSIFDYYDIYDSGISLVFCCSKHGTKSSDEMLSEHANLVGQLLEKYGTSTMQNKNHGKNLMHKLMLEGRLTIKEI
jgi:hypothetical protein